MLCAPKVGQRVQLWYAEKWHGVAIHHGQTGAVTVSSRGKPRNHGVLLDSGKSVVVPCGNLRKER